MSFVLLLLVLLYVCYYEYYDYHANQLYHRCYRYSPGAGPLGGLTSLLECEHEYWFGQILFQSDSGILPFLQTLQKIPHLNIAVLVFPSALTARSPQLANRYQFHG